MNDRTKIKHRIFYRFSVSLASPLSIAGGSNSKTDHDILITEDGTPFITGSSITGAVYNFLDTIGTEQQLLKTIFGMSQGENSRMSRIYISDILFENAKVSVRDGIRLDANKTTVKNAKYDYQIVETGASGKLFIEFVLYDNDSVTAENVEELMSKIVAGINSGIVRFGYKKQRGMGVLKIADQYDFKRFDYDNINAEDYLRFLDNGDYDPPCTIKKDVSIHTDSFLLILKLKQKGGISIRTYSAEPDAPDFAHITSGDKPIIPGSSWNGAIRTRAIDILGNSLQADESIISELKAIWGEIGEKEFRLSQIEVSESIIEPSNPDAGFVNITRNKINRFDQSTVDRALYSESSYFGGETKLEITIKNISQNGWVAGLILLTLADLSNGILAVGGQTAVGRGIFSGEIDLSDPKNADYISALYNKLKGEKEYV